MRACTRGEDHEIKTGETFCKLSGFAFCLLLFERVDELDGREEADLAAIMFDGLHAKGCRDMSFARAGATPSRALLRNTLPGSGSGQCFARRPGTRSDEVGAPLPR